MKFCVAYIIEKKSLVFPNMQSVTVCISLLYSEYWERLVLCNAMVWTCEVTGRPNLTFQEAQDNEAKALKFISNISPVSICFILMQHMLLIKKFCRSECSWKCFSNIRG